MSSQPHLSHYVRVHLAGASGGIDLFTRSSRSHHDPRTRELLAEIVEELHWEKARLQEMADALGIEESFVMSTGARLGERLGRLKPNNSLIRRSSLTDLVELEAMRTAVTGKRSGWQSMLAVADHHDGLDAEVLTTLLEMADRQLDVLEDEHRKAASRALS